MHMYRIYRIMQQLRFVGRILHIKLYWTELCSQSCRSTQPVHPSEGSVVSTSRTQRRNRHSMPLSVVLQC